MSTIARYLSREVLQASFFVFAALTTLFALFDLINELDSLGKGAYGFLAVLLYVALNIPGHLYDLLPVAALIGSLLALARLVSNSELTVMFASGLSMRRVAAWMMAVGVFFWVADFSGWGSGGSGNGPLRRTDEAQSDPSGGGAGVSFRVVGSGSPPVHQRAGGDAGG